MDEKLVFVADHLRGEWSMAALCEHYGISRKTGYKWLGRYRGDGPEGLVERSRAPRRHGRALAPAVAEAINDGEWWGTGNDSGMTALRLRTLPASRQRPPLRSSFPRKRESMFAATRPMHDAYKANASPLGAPRFKPRHDR